MRTMTEYEIAVILIVLTIITGCIIFGWQMRDYDGTKIE